MKNSNRFWWLLSLLLILTLVVVGCAQDAEPTEVAEEESAPEEVAEEAEPEDEAGPEPEKVTVEAWFEADEGGECLVEAVVNPVHEQSDSIFVEAVLQPDAGEAQRTALAGGAGPDIVDTPGPSFVYELVQADQLLPLDDIARMLLPVVGNL